MRLIKQIYFPKKYNKAPPILRVAAYCRASTNHEEQCNSMEYQKAYFEKKIQENDRWQLIGIYADKASGRNKTKRKEFSQLLSDCREGKIDLILTKSISRFGRNTLDMLNTLNELKTLRVDVYFEIENINLLNKQTELMMTIYTAIYQEESEQKSFNIRWGIRRSFESIDSKFQNRLCFGYKKGEDGRLIICPTESEIVKDIFNLYLNGYSLRQLSIDLVKRKIDSPRGFHKWSIESINKLLSNEKYTGNVMLQKTLVENYFSGNQVVNKGQREKYYISNSNPPIIFQA